MFFWSHSCQKKTAAHFALMYTAGGSYCAHQGHLTKNSNDERFRLRGHPGAPVHELAAITVAPRMMPGNVYCCFLETQANWGENTLYDGKGLFDLFSQTQLSKLLHTWQFQDPAPPLQLSDKILRFHIDINTTLPISKITRATRLTTDDLSFSAMTKKKAITDFCLYLLQPVCVLGFYLPGAPHVTFF